jgi:hypothetical protein
VQVREDAEQAKSTGGMVALYPADPTPLVVDDGEPAADLHVTLAYLGPDVTGWSEDRVRQLVDLLGTVVDDHGGPIEAAVIGHATFRPDSDEPVAVHLVGDTDRLAPLHQRITDVLDAVLGDDLHEQHAPWIPHLTGKYGADAGVLSYAGPVVLDRVGLTLAGQSWSFPLVQPDVDGLAREAFAHGWAMSGGPMTDRVRAAAVLAIEHVREHGPTRAVLEATMRLGSLEGTWAQVMDRREGLYSKHIDAAVDAWRDLTDRADVEAEVATFRTRAPEGTDQATRDRRRAEAVAAAIALLHSRANPGDAAYQRLILTISDALREAEAEGWAGSIAVAAEQMGRTGFNFDLAFTDGLERIAANPGTGYGTADSVAADIVHGAVTDLANAFTAARKADTDAEIADAARAVIRAGRSVRMTLDHAMGKAFARGILQFFMAEQVGSVDFITVGDERVCAICLEAENGNPWTPQSVPQPALHPVCRCTLQPSTPITAVRSVDMDRYSGGS